MGEAFVQKKKFGLCKFCTIHCYETTVLWSKKILSQHVLMVVDSFCCVGSRVVVGAQQRHTTRTRTRTRARVLVLVLVRAHVVAIEWRVVVVVVVVVLVAGALGWTAFGARSRGRGRRKRARRLDTFRRHSLSVVDSAPISPPLRSSPSSSFCPPQQTTPQTGPFGSGHSNWRAHLLLLLWPPMAKRWRPRANAPCWPQWLGLVVAQTMAAA